jgi:RHS repeat-associated protein
MDLWQDCRALPLIALVTVFSASVSYAQIPDAVTAAQAPVPGVGHGYIGMGAETVNPADGTPSFDLPIQTPTGRGTSFPFGIHYSGTEQFYLASTGNGGFGWSRSPAPPYELNGWSYELPNYTAAAFVTNSGTFTTQIGNQSFNCDGSHNYVFRGLDGVQSIDGLANNWNDPTNPYPNFCGSLVTAGTTTGDNGARATLNGTLGTEVQPSLTVTEPSGIVYQFPQGPDIVVRPPQVQPWGLLAQTITDRNGNQITLSGPNNPIAPMQAGSYIDTLRRNVVSWTGIGSSTGDQLSVAGLSGNIVVRWTTATITLPSQSHWVSGAPFANSCTENSNSGGTQIKVVSEIDLPNGTKYTFAYGGSGLTKITFPEGGYVRYVWGTYANSQGTYQAWWDNNIQGYTGNAYCFATFATPAVTDRYVSYDGATEVLHQHFAYATPNWSAQGNGAPSWTSKNTVVTSTDLLTGQSTVTNYTYGWVNGPWNPVDHVTYAMCGNQTSCTYANPGEWLISQVPVDQTVLYQDGSGNTLKTENKEWAGQYAMSAQQTVLANGLGSTKLLCYGTFGGLPIPGTVTDVYEYGFQTEGTYPGDPPSLSQSWPNGYACPSTAVLNTSALGPLRRHTHTAYHDFGAPGTYILDHPDNVIIYDGSGNQAEQTMYAYDAGTVSASGAATGLVSPPGLRGNTTSIQHLISGSTYATTSYTYFDTGQVASMIDPCGNTTCSDMAGSNHTRSYSYADSYAAGTGTPPGQTNAYLTRVTFPNTGVAHVENFTWGYNNGRLMSSSDQNTQPTSYQYTDTLARLTQVGNPDGGQTTYVYNDATFNAANHTPSVTATKTITSSLNQVATTSMDGMGHPVRSILSSDQNDGADITETTYDGFGRVRTKSNPHRSTSSSTDGTTTTSYDALGRVILVLQPDGSTATTSYSGQCTTVTDEAAKTRKSCTDGLGRVVQVFEDPSGLNYETDYVYDTLDNLLNITQKGGTVNSALWRTRSFSYDGISELLTANNPESGTVTYSYDANGNLSSKVGPRPSTTSGSLTTNYLYDSLNRLTKRSYVSSSTQVAMYGYDGVALSGCNTGNPSLPSPTNLVGRRSEMCAGPSHSLFSYDPMGRPVAESRKQVASGSAYTKNTSYTYFLDGELNTLTYPSTDVITFTPSGAGRLRGVSDANNNFVSAPSSGVMYTPNGALASMTNGVTSTFTGIVTNNTYNNLLQPILFSAGVQNQPSVFSLCYDFHLGQAINIPPCNFASNSTGDNGNVFQVINNLDSARSTTFQYDSLNRIQQANTILATGSKCWGEVYTVDAWANLTNIGGVNGMTGCSYEPLNAAPASVKNQLSGLIYDAAGDVTNDGNGNIPTYDAEARMATDAGVTYDYDADGVRVRKNPGGLYWPDTNGNVLAESGLTGQINEEYVFFNGARIARVDRPSGTVHYYFSNNLGSHTVVTSATGSCEQNIDYYPYGGIVADYCPTLAQHYEFIGKERDSESGFDYFGARYYRSTLGRFATPDRSNEGAQATDPQSWNAYLYAGNSPVSHKDPDGEDYHVCWYGKCTDMSDAEFDAWRRYHKNDVFINSAGKIYDRWTETQVGSEYWFDGNAARQSQAAAASVEFLFSYTLSEVAAAVGEVSIASLGARLSPQIARNAIKGRIGERTVEAMLRLKGYKIVGKNVTVRTSKGVRFVDYIVEKAGEYTAIEVKTGGAVRDSTQLAKDAAMESGGAAIGNNGGTLTGTTMKLKTVEVRPF